MNAVADAATAVGRLDGATTGQSVNVNPSLLARPLRTREAQASSEIENTIASAKEIALAEMDYLFDREDPREVVRYLHALSHGLDSSYGLRGVLVREMHSVLVTDPSKTPGKYRDGTVYIGNDRSGFRLARFVPPPPDRVQPLMDELFDFMESPPPDLHVLLLIGMCHYQFETIHPFRDGNGRIGRLLIILSLCRSDLLSEPLIYPSAYFEAHRQEYYDALHRVSTHGDWRTWLEMFLEAVRSQAADALDRLNELSGLRDRFLSLTADEGKSQRFVQLIDLLFEAPAVTVKSVSRRIGSSVNTARSYIELLERKGVLLEATGRKKDRVYVAPDILDIIDRD